VFFTSLIVGKPALIAIVLSVQNPANVEGIVSPKNLTGGTLVRKTAAAASAANSASRRLDPPTSTSIKL
jgi:hypothetical protein